MKFTDDIATTDYYLSQFIDQLPNNIKTAYQNFIDTKQCGWSVYVAHVQTNSYGCWFTVTFWSIIYNTTLRYEFKYTKEESITPTKFQVSNIYNEILFTLVGFSDYNKNLIKGSLIPLITKYTAYYGELLALNIGRPTAKDKFLSANICGKAYLDTLVESYVNKYIRYIYK